ncbi:ATP-dependent Clp protease ATP-binding subunit [Streptococcus koreensis]|uniref:ATP-dependent Clp protease ATP-binding subunit n=1 Tax=Streptococcus koreensis TaxID=2382163 RepID=A0ABM6ZBU7_9STRE|nr:ATP-dependent Clp protease ATP-binding subunit [Streptococcus koreensis]
MIETQDILFCILDICDTGMGYALGYYSLTKSKLLREYSKGKFIGSEQRCTLETDELKDFSKRRVMHEWITSSPVEIIQEPSSSYYLSECDEFPISEYLKLIFDFAEEMRLQNSPDGVIDSYWLLSGISQEQETNAHQLIYKQYLSTGRSSYSEDGLLDVFTNSWFRFRDLSDGKAERERASKERRAAHISSKLSNPDYSLLNDIATDITLKARNGELMEVVGRDDEIRKVEIALTRRDKNNVVLLGDGGVGKSAIVDGIAMRIARDEVLSLKGKKILQFSLNDLSATFGVFSSECIKRFIEEMKREKDVILFIDEVHMLGRAKHLTDLLKPLMARGDFRIIGATTPMEWSAYVSGDTAFVRRFEKVIVEEPSIEDTIKIVETVAPAYENFHHANFENDTIELAVKLAKKYLKSEKLPDSAFTIIDNAGALVRIEANQEVTLIRDYQNEVDELKKELEIAQGIEYNEVAVEEIRRKLNLKLTEFQGARNNLTSTHYDLKITKDDIKKAVEHKTNLKVKNQDMKVGKDADNQELLRLSNLKSILAEKVIDQSDATNSIAEAVIRSKTGFRNPKRPIGVFLFLGTSGVGKTETAKVLSEELTGSVEDLIRLDMSEYQQEHEVSKLIGAPPGYVGFGKGGILTNAVKSNPKSVVLLDEIEKAHPKVYDLMLQVFDDGILTDGMGQKVDFTNTIIILTSNLGLNAIKKDKRVGFTMVETNEICEQIIREQTMEAVHNFFRPELLNRIDEIVTFKPFSESTILRITRLLLEKEIEMIKKSGYELECTEKAVELLATRTYDPENGARPIRRGITKLIETPLSELIINNRLNKGDKVIIDSDGVELVFEVLSQ